jgi:xanthine/CO dehydrogenase XdhC/CoxF family maturation factor
MTLEIDELNIELPKSLAARKHSILRLVRSELLRLNWQEADFDNLSLPIISVSSQQTNLSIAASIAAELILSVRKKRINKQLF